MTHGEDEKKEVTLLERACPSEADVPFFNHCMRLARSMGMSWDEALRYVVEQRNGL